jgi:hypothetical protein
MYLGRYVGSQLKRLGSTLITRHVGEWRERNGGVEET